MNHPDKADKDEISQARAKEKFQRIQEAYDKIENKKANNSTNGTSSSNPAAAPFGGNSNFFNTGTSSSSTSRDFGSHRNFATGEPNFKQRRTSGVDAPMSGAAAPSFFSNNNFNSSSNANSSNSNFPGYPSFGQPSGDVKYPRTVPFKPSEEFMKNVNKNVNHRQKDPDKLPKQTDSYADKFDDTFRNMGGSSNDVHMRIDPNDENVRDEYKFRNQTDVENRFRTAAEESNYLSAEASRNRAAQAKVISRKEAMLKKEIERARRRAPEWVRKLAVFRGKLLDAKYVLEPIDTERADALIVKSGVPAVYSRSMARQHSHISKNHFVAVCEVNSTGVYKLKITDKSTNGTWVDHEPISPCSPNGEKSQYVSTENEVSIGKLSEDELIRLKVRYIQDEKFEDEDLSQLV